MIIKQDCVKACWSGSQVSNISNFLSIQDEIAILALIWEFHGKSLNYKINIMEAAV